MCSTMWKLVELCMGIEMGVEEKDLIKVPHRNSFKCLRKLLGNEERFLGDS